jgi:ribonuclease VapC
MAAIVLDSSALIASVFKEPGYERIGDFGGPVFVSAVNMTETRARLIDKGMEPDEIEESLDVISKTVVDFTDADAKSAAGLRTATRRAGLSLGDRACLALAIEKGGKAVTADRVWAELGLPVEVELFR